MRLKVYRAVEEKNPGITNILVMGPWSHGGWARGTGASLGNLNFGVRTSEYFREYVVDTLGDRTARLDEDASGGLGRGNIGKTG